MKLVIEAPRSEITNGEFRLTAAIGGPIPGECFYALPEAYADWVDAGRADCFMVGLLYTAMFAGVDIEVRAAVSEKLLFDLNAYAIPMLNGFDPRLKRIQITAAATAATPYPDARHVGTGFSGGIDSFFTIYERGIRPETPENFRIDTLFFFNVGSHGMGSTPERLQWLEEKFQARLKHLAGFAAEIGLPVIPVNSNLHRFHQSGHLQTHTLASMSAALFVGRRLGKYYFGSAGYDYHALIRNADTHDSEIALLDPMLLPLLSTESFMPIADGAEFSRTGKTARIVDFEPAHRYLNVCGNPETIDTNCSVCFKCKRTMLTLDILGCLDRFAGVFTLDRYRGREEKRFIAEMLNGRNDSFFFEDVVKLAETHDYDLAGRTDRPTRLYMKFTRTGLYRKLRKAVRGS
jgi:hypothetical protein